MRIDVRVEDVKIDSAVFADKSTNHEKACDVFGTDYATDVKYTKYAGVPTVIFDTRYMKISDWDNAKKAVDAIIKAQTKDT